MLESINPATGQKAYQVASLDEQGLRQAIDAAATAAETWRKTTIAERAQVVVVAHQAPCIQTPLH